MMQVRFHVVLQFLPLTIPTKAVKKKDSLQPSTSLACSISIFTTGVEGVFVFKYQRHPMRYNPHVFVYSEIFEHLPSLRCNSVHYSSEPKISALM